MNKCNHCGAVFDTPSTRKEYHSEIAEFGYTPYETIRVCPRCGSEDYDEARFCECCGEVSENTLCDSCRKSFEKEVESVIEKYFLDVDDGWEYLLNEL